jgi:hypothetical protein
MVRHPLVAMARHNLAHLDAGWLERLLATDGAALASAFPGDLP